MRYLLFLLLVMIVILVILGVVERPRDILICAAAAIMVLIALFDEQRVKAEDNKRSFHCTACLGNGFVYLYDEQGRIFKSPCIICKTGEQLESDWLVDARGIARKMRKMA
jgi:hypothetical protein